MTGDWKSVHECKKILFFGLANKSLLCKSNVKNIWLQYYGVEWHAFSNYVVGVFTACVLFDIYENTNFASTFSNFSKSSLLYTIHIKSRIMSRCIRVKHGLSYDINCVLISGAICEIDIFVFNNRQTATYVNLPVY